jgi:hypothetical protein
MQKQLSRYILKVYSTTIFLGLLLGDIIMYVKDVHQHTYNDNWDNPFYNYIFFLLIGIGSSIIPVLAFYVLIKGLLYTRLPYGKSLTCLSGLACTIVPFISLYNMVNEGYHRDNVVICAVCFIVSLALSFIFYRMDLSALFNHSNSSKKAI